MAGSIGPLGTSAPGSCGLRSVRSPNQQTGRAAIVEIATRLVHFLGHTPLAAEESGERPVEEPGACLLSGCGRALAAAEMVATPACHRVPPGAGRLFTVSERRGSLLRWPDSRAAVRNLS